MVGARVEGFDPDRHVAIVQGEARFPAYIVEVRSSASGTYITVVLDEAGYEAG